MVYGSWLLYNYFKNYFLIFFIYVYSDKIFFIFFLFILFVIIIIIM